MTAAALDLQVERPTAMTRPSIVGSPSGGSLDLSHWTPLRRLAACNRLRTILEVEEGLKSVAEAVAELVLDVMHAKSVSIVLLDDRGYRDLVNVGQLGRGQFRFPEEEPYGAGSEGIATIRRLGGESYITIGTTLRLLQRYDRKRGEPLGNVIGVPILRGEEVWGETFALREKSLPEFAFADVEALCELMRQFATALPHLLGEQL